jgi:hypothetical protein
MEITFTDYQINKKRTYLEVLEIIKKAEKRFDSYRKNSSLIYDKIIDKFYEEGKVLYIPFKEDGDLYYYEFSESSFKVNGKKTISHSCSKFDPKGSNKKEIRSIKLSLLIDYDEKAKLGNEYRNIQNFLNKLYLYYSIKQKFYEDISYTLLNMYKGTSNEFMPKVLFFNIGEYKFLAFKDIGGSSYVSRFNYDIIEITGKKEINLTDEITENKILKTNIFSY